MSRIKFLNDIIYESAELREILGPDWNTYKGLHLLLLTEIIFQLARIFEGNKTK